LDFDNDRKLYFESFPGFKTLQTFPDDKGIKSKINLTRQVSIDGDSYPYGDFDFSKNIIDVKVMMGLEKLNDMGAGIYLCINTTDGKGRKKENITTVRSVFCDFDDPDKPLPDLRLTPSMVVESSPNKWHVYFFTDDCPLEGFTGLQKALAYNLGSDPRIHDLPRILRVPGFYHCKKEPFMTRIASYTGLKYSYGLLVDTFPPEHVEKWSAPKYKAGKFDDSKPFTGIYGSPKGNRNCEMAKIIGGMLKRNKDWGYIENEVWKHNSASNPPLSTHEVKNIIKSMRRY
jgi:hypothetical protein